MRAAVYARFSSNLQSDASIEDQVRTCRERIEQEGWSFVEVYKDAAISGATTLRPGYQKLLEDARANRFDIVLAEALDRLSRDQEDVAGLYKKLSFAGVKLITLAEGEINELHIGLKGSMNAIFLKDLAAKIRRGQIGRVIAGFSAGGISYGYEVVRELDANGDVIRGKRNINPEQSEIVRQIYKEYVGGKSPRAIAADLNRDGIPSPRDGQWNASTINGHRSRHNGILQNELYIGLMVYNRIRMVRDPETGKRISRINPKDVWVVTEVPELRIIPDELWNQAQAIKARYSNQPAHKNRRPKSLLSGLLACGECGSSFSIVRPGKYGCSAHREKGTCENGRQIARDVLERRVLAGIKERLLHPDFLTEFTREFHRELKRQRARGTNSRKSIENRIAKTDKRIQRLVSAIADGIDTLAMRKTLIELEQRKTKLSADLSEAENHAPIKLHPNLSEMYRRKVEALENSLNENENIRREAGKILRALIRKIILRPGLKRGEMSIEVYGEPGAVLALASGNPAHTQLGMIKVVAEEGLEPPTRGL